MHTLLLHIGTDKTGTTSLQQFLTDNRTILEEKSDWIYPDLSNQRVDNLSGLLLEREEDVVRVTTSNEREKIYVELENLLENKNVILSSEQFYIHWDETIKILGEIRDRFSEILVVIYFKRQDLYMESSWGECVKWGIDSDLHSFFEHEDHRNQCDYCGRVLELCKILKKEQLIIRSYERTEGACNFDVVADFLTISGLDKIKDEFVFGMEENKRLSRDCLELMRLCNEARQEQFKWAGGTEWNFIKMFSDISANMNSEKCNRGGRYFSPEEREDILKRYEDGNEQIAQMFLRDRKELFYDKRVDLSYYNPQYDSFTECIVRTFLALYMRQKNMICFLEKARNRKIAFWGGGRRCRRLFREGHRADIIIDNNPAIRGGDVSGVPVLSPREISDWKQYYIVVTIVQYEEVKEQCMTMGLTEREDFSNADDIYM